MLGKFFPNLIYSVALGVVGCSFVPFLIIMSGNSGFQPMNILLVGIMFFLAFFIILTVIYSLYYQAYINRYYYDCGPDFITIKKGVFAPSEIHVQYQKIQDVYVDQDIFDRMFGLYDVHIASATVTSGIEAHIDGVDTDVAESLKNILLGKIKSGGNISANSQTPSYPTQNIQAGTSAQPVQFQSDKTISSKTYPISGSWIYMAIFSGIFISLILTLILTPFTLKALSLLFGLPVLLLLFAFVFVVYMIYIFVWKKNFYFEFMPDYILLRTGVLNKEEKHVPYKSIQNIINSQGIFDRMFGLSKVTAQDASSRVVGSGRYQQTVPDGISLVWQPKDKADELSNILNDIVSKINPQSSRSTGL